MKDEEPGRNETQITEIVNVMAPDRKGSGVGEKKEYGKGKACDADGRGVHERGRTDDDERKEMNVCENEKGMFLYA